MRRKLLDRELLGSGILHNELWPTNNNWFFQKQKTKVLISSIKTHMVSSKLVESCEKIRHDWHKKIEKQDPVSTQSAFTCSKLRKEELEQGVKYVQVNNKDARTRTVASFWCLYC